MINDIFPLKTNRLVIRKTNVNDIDLLIKMDGQEITQKYLGGIKNKTREERIEFLEKRNNSLTVCLNDKPIGFIELKINNNIGELSYIFDYDYCNKGYCTEAAKKIIEVGFNDLKLSYIFADTVKDNISSKRVLEKLGFKYKDSTNKDSITFLNYYLYNKG